MAFRAKTPNNKHKSRTVKEAITEAKKEEMVGLNVRMPKSKRLAFKSKAAISNDSMQDIILRAIDSYISK